MRLVLAAFVLYQYQDARAAQAPVALGTVTTYTVLAGSTITSTGTTTVNGDLGLSPGTAVTGFPPGAVNGTIHIADAAAAQAQVDLTTAYNDAAGRTPTRVFTPIFDLGGLTLTNGVYSDPSSLAITGTLTLDAQGDTNAVWIFQAGSTLVTASGSQVLLINGAQAANVGWQVGSSATLGTGSVFKGNILALASITVTTGVTVEGRLLARTAAVTLDSDTITLPNSVGTTAPTVSSIAPANGATGVAISANVAASFSETMNPSTISTATFTLMQGTTAVAGTVSYAGVTATFAPSSTLAPSTTYTATITTGVKDLAGNALAVSLVWSFTTAATAARQAPVALGTASTFAVLAASTVTSTGATAVNGDLGLSPGTSVTGSPTVNGTIHIADAAAAQAQVDLTTAYNDAAGRIPTRIFTPIFDLGGLTLTNGVYSDPSSLAITGTLTLDAQGDTNAVWIFQAGSTLVTASGSQVLLINGAQAANVFWQVGSSATLGTTSNFKGNILALASITVTTSAAVEGRLLARTGAVTLDTNLVGLGVPADTTPPTVSSTDPANGAAGVAINKQLTVTFSEAMDPATISATTFTLNQGASPVAGTVTYVGTTASFTPAGNFVANTTYTATMTSGAKDLAGNALATSLAWSFTTAATAAGQAPVVLGSASTYAVLAGSTVTSTGATTVNGDLGLSPGTAVTGFPPGAVNGTIHAGDAVAAQAQLDLATAYNDAAGRTPTRFFTPIFDLGGLTLTNGVYNDPSSLAITGTLTLDAQGDTNAVWIFQAGSTLVTASGSQVLLINGAKAANVFWQVGSSATLGTTSNFKGNILALASITVTTGAAVEGRLLARNGAVTLDTNLVGLGVPADTTPPTVSSTDPANGATGVAINKQLTVTFSEAMDPTTISATTFTLNQGATPVAGTVTYVGTTASFTPAGNLAVSTTYTATLTTGAKDLAGNALASVFVWSFTTGMGADTTAPTVTFTVPANAATGVAISQKIAATFSEAMDPLTISTVSFTLMQGSTPVPGTVTYAAGSTTAIFSPASGLAPLTTFTATITAGAKDLASNSLLNDFAWSFTTGATPDTIAPTVTLTVPANAAIGVAINQAINATCSELMDPATISTATFLLTGPGATPVTGTVAYNLTSQIATFTSASNLAANTTYTAMLTTGAKDLAGNALATSLAWSFTTAATTAGQAPVVLGSASTFTVLAGSTVTSTGATTVNGNLGLSPGTAVTGFPPGAVNGTIHAGDAAAAQAQLDLTTAYSDAAGRTVGAIAVAGNLGGQTLTPGLYTSTSSLAISSGDLTLDAQGDANAVFIFQMASTLTTTAGRQVILSGGAQAANIFWQVGSSATLGTASVFKGNILALASITVTTGAAVEGRLLARTGAVTLDTNLVGLGVSADTTPPTVSSTDPANGANGVAINKKLAVTFSEAMDPATISATTFTLNQGATPVAGTVTYVGTTATFAPASNLAVSTTYTATLTTGAKDLAGNALASVFVWSFTTGVGSDTTAPTVTFTVPANAATGVAIGQKIAVTFSEAMDPLSINTVSFTLMQGSTPVPGTVSYVGVTAIFTPGVSLSLLTAYTATVTIGATDLAGNALASQFVWSFTTGASPDTTPPTVSFASGALSAMVLAFNTKIAATFSEPMDPLTISTATVMLNQGPTPVVGTVTYAGVTATFNPLSALASSTTYTVTITTGTRDLTGNALAGRFLWNFTTGANPDTTAPTITLTVPANAATGVPVNQNISATFSEAMDPLTTTTLTFTLNQGPTPVVGTVTYAGVTATFNPLNALAPSTAYTATVTTGTRDLAGNALAGSYVWTFTTGAAPDTTAPSVTLTVPANAVTGVPVNQNISTTFSEAMDPLSISTATFTLNQGPKPVTGTVSYVGLSATFTPASDLSANTTYTATLTTGAKDLAGNALAISLTWSFTTAATVAGQAPVVLGSASTFTVLAGSTVTSTGATTVNGNLGLSPGTAVTGFPPGAVNGTIHAGDAVAAQAQLDLATAYNDAAGRSVGAIAVAGNLGGQTLTPGLYTSTSSLAISSGDLTLDAQGDTNAVFIFQMASTLTTTAGRQVILSGGAQAANIYWQVGSSATLGTTSNFKGNILALASITVTTGAAVEGRLLARAGAVTLDANPITNRAVQPTPPRFGPINLTPEGLVILIITNTPGRTFTIQTSADLTKWTTLATPTPTVSPDTFIDSAASAESIRYYRAF